MKKIFLMIMLLCISICSFSENFFATFDARLHQIKGDITVNNIEGVITIHDFTYDGKGNDVYIVLSKDKNFKGKKKISKKLKRAYINEDTTFVIKNLDKLMDKGYNTISVYTEKYKYSFADAKLIME
jgi:hypothetical protein